MGTCHEPHSRWLEQALLEGHASIPEDELAALEACSVCSSELAELAEAVTLMNERKAQLQAEEAEDLAFLLEEKRPEDHDLVRAALAPRRLPGTGAETRANGRSKSGPWRLFLALAAASIVAAVILRRDAQPEPATPEETMLGVIAQGAIIPILNVYDAAGLQLSWEPLAARSYRIVIQDAQHEEVHTISVTSPELQIDAARSSPWPTELTIEITPLSASGRPTASSTTLSVRRED